MVPGQAWRRIVKLLFQRHGAIKSFDRDLEASGGLLGRSDSGGKAVDVHKIVGSVGRADTLRSDFFYRKGKAMTNRFVRVGQAMRQGKTLPPLELYKIKRAGPAMGAPPQSAYYVVDGHHRVAMARQLGQDFLDAHVIEYRVGGVPGESSVGSSADAPVLADPAVGSTVEAVAIPAGSSLREAAPLDPTAARNVAPEEQPALGIPDAADCQPVMEQAMRAGHHAPLP